MEPPEDQHSMRGVYGVAYDADIEWVIKKGVACNFYRDLPLSSECVSFARGMAASVVAKMLNDPAVFLEWPRCNQGKPRASLKKAEMNLNCSGFSRNFSFSKTRINLLDSISFLT